MSLSAPTGEGGLPAVEARVRHRRPWPAILFGLLLLGVVVLLVAAVVPVPYAILTPGPVTNVLGPVAEGPQKGKPLLEPTNAAAYPDTGALYFTTVLEIGSPSDKPSALETFFAWVGGSDEILPLETLYPEGSSEKTVASENVALMDDSQRVATAVALRKLGMTVTEHIAIVDFPPGSPNKGLLRVGDRFVSIGGTAVTTADEITAAIAGQTAGTEVPVVVLRGGAQVHLSLHTQAHGGRTTFGIYLGRTFAFPVDVKVNIENVSGPSAGLMLGLGIYDILQPGSLTNGRRIAGTGEIGDDGTVGPIGGIDQKMIGAVQGGAQWFLAPKDNCDEVFGHVPSGLTVTTVTTFDEALKAVEAIAAGRTSGLPTCTAADVTRIETSPAG